MNTGRTIGGEDNMIRPVVLFGSTDADYYLLLAHVLEVDGFKVLLGRGVEEIVHLAIEHRPDAVLLDCRPGSFSASQVCLRLKEDALTTRIPTIALIGPGAESQYVDLLKAGIDDSFIRPIAPLKLLEFLRHLSAGKQKGTSAGNGLLVYRGIEMDLEHRRVRRNRIEIHLGPTEFRLLQHLMQNPGQVYSREELIAAAWPNRSFVEGRTVNVHMGRLRKALNANNDPNLIRTIRSAGYSLDEHSSIDEDLLPS
jgi:two-component system phosphate regulon response regulator PhoB